MMNRAAAVAATLLLSLATVAHADDEAPAATPATQTTTAQTLVVVTPNAPIVITNGQQQNAPAMIAPPGAAEAPPTVAAPAAPINENWNNVSHINGTVVPVGDRNAYLYNFKKNNIQTDPLAWMFGYYQVAASHALTQNIALSVELSGWSTNHGSTSGFEVAASLPIYFRRTFSGPFLEPGLVVHSDNNSYDNCYDCSYDTTSSMSHVWAGPEVLVGWSWMFDSGLNISGAFGAAKRMSDNQGSSSDSPDPVGYFRVGYAF